LQFEAIKTYKQFESNLKAKERYAAAGWSNALLGELLPLRM
jgi:hypothetical protein